MTDGQLNLSSERPMKGSLFRGVRRLCPNCGETSMFSGYLTVKDECENCGLELHHHRADDAPAWMTILITAHLVAPIMLFVATTYALSDNVHMILWPVVISILALIVLPYAKGFVIAFQWARRMHGFDSDT